MRRWLAGLLALLVVGAVLAAERPSTAQANVSVLPEPLAMPGLNRSRTIRLYLPPSYASAPERRYPVIYMHDGQNLFDAATAYAGEWEVDETLNALAASTGFEAIVVGIDNGAALRMKELSPVDHPRIGTAEGPLYLSFIVEVLKPLIDRSYRTLPDAAHTAMIGSSMGGLISHAALQRYPEVFGRFGILSPSYWVAPGLFGQAERTPLPAGARVYIYAGGREVETEAQARRMANAWGLASPGLKLSVNARAEHNEAAWRAELPQALRWLFELP